MKRLLMALFSFFVILCIAGCNGENGSDVKYRLSENKKYYIVEGVGKIQNGEVIIPEEYKGLPVREVADYAFDGCDSLESIIMSETVLTIGSNVFNDCGNLLKVEMPGVTSLSESVFNGCTTVEEITIPIDFLSYLENKGPLRLSVNNIRKITITPGVKKTRIGNGVFQNCTNLRSVNIKSGIMEIGDEAFRGCENLNTVILPDGLDTICENAFMECKRLDGIDFPDTLTRIESGAFWGCASLTLIVLPDSVETLGGAAFRECSSLNYIALSEKLGGLGPNLFKGCPITEIQIPANIWRIESTVFSDTELEYAVFENVSGWAFWEDGEKHEVIDEGIADSYWIAAQLKNGRVDGIGRYDSLECSRG